MNENIFTFELDGRQVLGFDTGLDAHAFAQAKMAQFITQSGYLVRSGGAVEEWKSSGVVERNGSMVIWGPFFEGERFDRIILNSDAAEGDGGAKALDALRYWMAARVPLEKRTASLWPAAALVADSGSVLFPPGRLVLRCLQAEGSVLVSAEPFVHPDRAGEDAEVFTAAAVLYRVIAGETPFQGGNAESIHQDIREGVFLPLRLAAPGVDERLSSLVDGIFAPPKTGKTGVKPGEIRDLLGPPKSGREPASFFQPLSGGELKQREAEREQYSKNTARTVGARRFVARNTAVILGVIIAAVVAGLAARSIIAGRQDLPTTEGLTSREVVDAWYGAFDTLDHTLMQEFTVNRAGRDDIQMVTNFYVLTRVRQAYEYSITGTIPAQEWLDQGSPPPDRPVFGVSGLGIEQTGGHEEGEEIQYRAAYTLWIPQGGEDPAAASDSDTEPMPGSHPRIDELTLTRRKGAWRISDIVHLEE
ncbi:MAG: hypothetical protein LBI86_05660 [Treponema sp.]|jgi:hypothetical protein|nr:hypothetical protein [Treponema sp.]